MNALIEQCRRLGVRLSVEGGALAYDAPKGAMTSELAAALKAHKPAIVAALAHPRPLPSFSDASYELVGYFEEQLAAVQRYAPSELHMNSRPPTLAAVRDAVKATVAHARARGFAQRQVIEALEGYPEAARFLPAELGQPPAPKGLGGVSPELAGRLSAEDLLDIAVGDIPVETVQQYEQVAIAREPEDLREFFEERVGILERAGLPKPKAEAEAARLVATLARNRSCSWASLRSALADYPVLAAQMPVTDGPVNALPRGLPTVAVLKGRRVLRQGVFAGSHEVNACAPEPDPPYERFTRHLPPSGTVIPSFYCGGATLREMQVSHPLAQVEAEAVEDSWVELPRDISIA